MDGGPIAPDHDLIGYYLRRYGEYNMTAIVDVVRIADPEVDDADDNVATSLDVKRLYYGKARLYKVSGGGSMDMDDEVAFSTSYISIPARDEYGAWVKTQVHDLIKVAKHDDPDVVGRVFRVLDVDAGGQWVAVRRHMVTGAQRFESWTWAYE